MNDKTFMARFDSDYRAAYDGASPENFNALDFVSALGSVSGALLYSRLFLPEFVEVDGMILLKESIEDAGGSEGAKDLYRQYGSKGKVEQALNAFYINLNFPNHLNTNAPGDDRLLAEQLAVTWSLRLRQLYPDRAFIVRQFEEDGEAGVLFCQANLE